MVALYLRGLNRPHFSSATWPATWRFLRAVLPSLETAEGSLRAAGFTMEASALGAANVLGRAEQLVTRGIAVSIENEQLPLGWRSRCRVPALWKQGELPPGGGWVGVVGVRTPTTEDATFAREIGREAACRGFGIISGGAKGCDALAQNSASSAGGPVLELVPFGLDWTEGWVHTAADCRLSVCAPTEGFSRQTAMERNALIYSGATLTVVVRARYREGGTWHGAVNALRRRLGAVAVHPQPEDTASRVLMTLGAAALATSADLSATVERATEDAMAIPGLVVPMPATQGAANKGTASRGLASVELDRPGMATISA
jgi:predicted Rossmann fold nucleotide-binding protein DprA/Smf involved in DNA uptake